VAATPAIRATPDTPLGDLLPQADRGPLILEVGGARYRLAVETDAVGAPDSSSYDPEQVRAAIRATAGTWADVDVDTFLARLYRAREDGSRPISRP